MVTCPGLCLCSRRSSQLCLFLTLQCSRFGQETLGALFTVHLHLQSFPVNEMWWKCLCTKRSGLGSGFLFTHVLVGQARVSSLQPRSSGLPHLHPFCSYGYDLLAGRIVVLRATHRKQLFSLLLHYDSVSKLFQYVGDFFCLGPPSFLQYPRQILITTLVASFQGS